MKQANICLLFQDSISQPPLRERERERERDINYDYILTNKKSFMKNVDVIQRVNVGSDHRLVRGTIKTNTGIERSRMMRPGKSKVNMEVLSLMEGTFSCIFKTALKC